MSLKNDGLISIQDASNLLGVSVDYFMGLIESQEMIGFTMEGEQEVCRQEVLDYKKVVDERRMQVLDELTAEAEELNMGY